MLTRNDLQNVLAHINLGDDAHREITQAEFDALTDEEKDDGTIYFITDGVSKNIFLDDNTPVGAIMPYGGDNDPAYWLICDGRAVSRTAYAELFAVIGTTYGMGDGSTTFNIPDLRGRVAVGHNTTYGLGTNGGEAVHTLNKNEIPNYDIGFMATVVPGNHTQWNNGGIIGAGGATGASQGKSGTIYMAGTVNTQPQYGWQVKSNGGGQAHNNMQPYLVTNYIIKTSSAAQKEQTNIDLFYPIGSCYETTDSEFDPSIRWGGVWERRNGTIITTYSSSTISDIITPGSNVTISQAVFIRQGPVGQLYINWSNKTAISANADGNITNVRVGTLLEQAKPLTVTTATSYGDNGGPAFYYLGADGSIDLGAIGGTGAARTMATGWAWQLGTTYILKNSEPSTFLWHRIA